MIDSNGFRANVGIILTNRKDQVFWGKRETQYSIPKVFLGTENGICQRWPTPSAGITRESVNSRRWPATDST